MVLLLYILSFGIFFLIRYRAMTGERMKLQIDINGQSFYEHAVQRNKKSPNKNVWIGLPVKQRLFFKIAPEGILPRILKGLGVAEEFQSGDETTDKLLFISDDPRLFQDILNNGKLRSALQELVARHPKIRIRAFGHKLWLEANDVPPGWLDTHRRDILAGLWELQQSAENAAAYSADQAPRISYAHRAAIFMVAHAAILSGAVAGLIAFLVDDTHIQGLETLVISSLVLVPFCAGVWIILMTVFLRRSMWLVLALGDFIIFGLAALALSLPLGAIEANRQLAQAAPKELHIPLTQKECSLYCKKSKGKSSSTREYHLSAQECHPSVRSGTIDRYRSRESICRSSASMRYKFTFPAWKEGETAAYTQSVDAQLFDSINTGSVFVFPVHPGALGAPWIDEDEVRPLAPQKTP